MRGQTSPCVVSQRVVSMRCRREGRIASVLGGGMEAGLDEVNSLGPEAALRERDRHRKSINELPLKRRSVASDVSLRRQDLWKDSANRPVCRHESIDAQIAPHQP